MLRIPPILHNFPFVGIYEAVDIYSIMKYETMHKMFLGISRLVSECVGTMLKDDSKFCLQMNTPSGTPCTFKSIRKSVLHGFNELF